MNAPAKINNGKFNVQYGLNWTEQIILDLFAGGGGASTGLELGLKRTVFAAINHNPRAVSMHTVNHPHARHFVQDVFAVDPLEATKGQPVGWMHASPDCTHHSQAAGGQPRSTSRRKTIESECYGKALKLTDYDSTSRYPRDVQFFSSDKQQGSFHPTQKPVALMEYLIRTYTNEGDTVLDNCMGSGTTGVACVNTKRNFIGIEKEQQYFDVACKRINDAVQDRKFDLFGGAA